MESIFITGCSTGIGRASADRLRERGFRVLGTVRRPEDAPPGIEPVVLDVTDAASVAAAAAAVPGEGLKGLVNNAGIALSGPLEFFPLEELRRQYEVNVFGVLRVTQALLPHLRRGRGRIVNVSSTSGRAAFPLLGPYGSSKFALEALSDALRMELAHWKIHVSVVEPGPVRTPIWERAERDARRILDALPREARERYAPLAEAFRAQAQDSVARAIGPEEVARRIEHALTARRPRTRYVVGPNRFLFWVFTRLLPDRWRDRLIHRRLRG